MSRKPPGNRKLVKKLVVFCEGSKNKSENAYFKALIADSNKINIEVRDTQKNTGKELVKEAKQAKKEFPNDELWVVYDQDGYTKHPETFNIAIDNNIKIAFSSISFEIWILLHYEYTSYQFLKSDEVIKYIKDKQYIDYKKNDPQVYKKIKDKLDTAIQNAINLQKFHHNHSPNGQIFSLNPYTNIHELIDAIKTFKDS